MKCPCSSGNTYEFCCGVAHQEIQAVQTAEQLMRSRYAAFTLGNGDYLMLSHHSSTRPINEKDDIVSWANSLEWLRLEIINKSKGLESNTEGSVEFKAYFRENGKERFIHENSRFVKENDHWAYLGFV